MKAIRIIILEDDLETLAVLFKKLAELENELGQGTVSGKITQI